MPEMPDWQRFLSDDDRTTIERGRWAKRVGFGAHPAVILIDVQNYMVGEKAATTSAPTPIAALPAGPPSSRPGASSARPAPPGHR